MPFGDYTQKNHSNSLLKKLGNFSIMSLCILCIYTCICFWSKYDQGYVPWFYSVWQIYNQIRQTTFAKHVLSGIQTDWSQ